MTARIFLRPRADGAVDPSRQGRPPVNELMGIVKTGLPEATYAANVADSIRGALTPRSESPYGEPVRFPSDEETRERLTTALNLFSDAEIRAATSNLLSDRVRHLKQLVQQQGTEPAARAALGRQFTILCEVLAEKLPQPLSASSGQPALKALRAWDWDDRFSRGTSAPASNGSARIGRTVHRGAQRFFSSLFPWTRSDQDRVRDAYNHVVRAVSGFIAAIDTPAALRRFNESGARLMKAVHQYDATCESATARVARSTLQLPGNSVQLLERAFFDAMGKTRGTRVDVLGRTLSNTEWMQALHGLQEMMHDIHRAGPRPSNSMAGRLFNRKLEPWRPPLGVAEARTLVSAMRHAAENEAGIRASTEILRTLSRAAPAEIESQTLDDIRALEQRFRPLQRQFLPTSAQAGAGKSLHRFVDLGMKRLSPAERGRIEHAVFNLDQRPSSRLAQDGLWQAVVRHCQQSRSSRVRETA